jgi:cytochrome c553
MGFVSARTGARVAGIAMLLAAALANAQNVANGHALYQQYCQVCHGAQPAGGPERAANDPALIRNAIRSNVPDMRSLSFLTDQNLTDIAAWIASLTSAPPPVPAFDYTDLWWNPAEDGWGFNIMQHSQTHIIFGVMYTYDTDRKPVWFVLPGGTWTTATQFIGNWYRVSGPAYNGVFDPAKVHVGNPVGSVQLNFTDASHASFSFSVNGVQVVKQIARQPF